MPARRRCATSAIAIAIATIVLGCSQAREAGRADEDGSDGLALACERAIAHLDSLILESQHSPTVKTGALVEARALRGTAAELYLDGEYELALEFIDEAITILGKSP